MPLAIFHGTPVRTGQRGGSAGAGLAGGRISCWVMSPQARALRRLAVKAEATEWGKNTERGANVAPHTYYRKARPRAPLPELSNNGQTGNGAWR